MNIHINSFIEQQLNVNDRVYIKNTPRPDGYKKLAMKWKGPCII